MTKKRKRNSRTKGKISKNNSWILNLAILIAFIYASYLTINKFFPVKDYEYIKYYSEENNLDDALVCAIINVESSFNPSAVSNKGASGYMQLMEQTANWGIETLGVEATYDDIFQPELNIALGTWYFRVLLEQFGSEDLAIISYNAGSGNVSKWISENNGDEDETIKNIPFDETKKYFYKIKMNKFIYKMVLKFE